MTRPLALLSAVVLLVCGPAVAELITVEDVRRIAREVATEVMRGEAAPAPVVEAPAPAAIQWKGQDVVGRFGGAKDGWERVKLADGSTDQWAPVDLVAPAPLIGGAVTPAADPVAELLEIRAVEPVEVKQVRTTSPTGGAVSGMGPRASAVDAILPPAGMNTARWTRYQPAVVWANILRHGWWWDGPGGKQEADDSGMPIATTHGTYKLQARAEDGGVTPGGTYTLRWSAGPGVASPRVFAGGARETSRDDAAGVLTVDIPAGATARLPIEVQYDLTAATPLHPRGLDLRHVDEAPDAVFAADHLARYREFNRMVGGLTVRFLDTLAVNNHGARGPPDLTPKSSLIQGLEAADHEARKRAGIALEWAIAFCDEVDAIPYMLVPPMLSDEGVRAWAERTKIEALNRGIRLIVVEFGNEHFNAAPAFYQGWAYIQGLPDVAESQEAAEALLTAELGPPPVPHGYSHGGARRAGQRAGQALSIVREVFGSDIRLIGVIGGQTADTVFTCSAVAAAWHAGFQADAIATTHYYSRGVEPWAYHEGVLDLPLQERTDRLYGELLRRIESDTQYDADLRASNEIARWVDALHINYEGGNHMAGDHVVVEPPSPDNGWKGVPGPPEARAAAQEAIRHGYRSDWGERVEAAAIQESADAGVRHQVAFGGHSNMGSQENDNNRNAWPPQQWSNWDDDAEGELLPKGRGFADGIREAYE